jgi:uncharacterized protein YciW
MKDDKKSSIIKEALTDYNAIKEAAETNAKKKLAEEFPEKFSSLLKEEINKNKSKKESYKKLDVKKESEESDDVETNKESVMKNQTKETKKVVKENAGEGKPFDEKAKGLETVKEEREKEFMADIESDTPNQGKGETEKGNIFTDKVNPSSGKPISNISEEFDVTELDVDSVGSALENADDEDEVLTMEEIESEIASMENLNGMNAMEEAKDSDPYSELVNMRNKLDEMIKGFGVEEQKNQGGKQSIPGRENGGPTTQMIDEELPVEEQKNQGGKQSIPGRENGGPTTQMIDEEPITDADIEAVLGAPAEQSVDEASGMAHSTSKHVAGDHLPGKDFAPQRHKRYGSVNNPQNESTEKKFESLLEENKKLTKKMNETKKYKESVGTLVESYKTALDKYRNQLKEMAVFNTNLAHVNNLLVNEELALTQEDKIKIINEFKKVDSITESQKKYKAVLTEMKESKKTLTESIEEKVNASIQPSSKQKLDEVVEKTAYENDKHIQKMKKLIEYVEHRGKKNNL